MAKGRRVVLAAPLLLVGFLAKPAEAQLPLFVAAGPTFTSLSGDGVPDDFGTKTGFFVSVGTAIPIGDGPLAIRPFVGFTKRGGSGEVDEDEHLDLGYIDVPVFVGAGFPIGRGTELNVGAGPRISFQVSCQLEDGDQSEDCEENESLDYGLLGDVGVRYAISPTTSIGVGAGYDLGLAEIFSDVDVKNRGFYIRATASLVVGD